MRLFKKLFSSLNEGAVKYLLAGGVAVNLYGIERATADIDIVVKLDAENVSRFVKVARKLGLKPRIPVGLDDFVDAEKRAEWVRDKGMTVFSLYDAENPFFLVDVFVQVPFDFDKVYDQKETMELEDTNIPVVPIEDLIAMKEKSSRPQDQADIFYLRKIMEEWKHDG